MAKTKTVDVNDVRETCQQIGDKLKDNFDKTEDLKVAQGSISAYRTALAASKAQLVYKKLTGMPMEIDFLK